MELADNLIKHDMEEVQRLLQETLEKMGITRDQMRELEEELRRRLGDQGGGLLFGSEDPPPPPGPTN
jgi:hypothetical protein